MVPITQVKKVLTRGDIALWRHKRALGFRHRQARVVARVCLVLRAVICNAANDLFRGVTAGKSSPRIRPIGFRLAPMPCRNSPPSLLRVFQVTRRFRIAVAVLPDPTAPRMMVPVNNPRSGMVSQ
jgi:hypothetical protein